VLVEVGDEDVIETFDAEPDREHGPGDSASFMAGPISDTVGHSDPSGEVVRVAPGASRAELVERRLAAAEAAAAASSTGPDKTHQAEGRGKTCADREVHRGQASTVKSNASAKAGSTAKGSGLWLGANCQAGIPDQTGCAETCRQAGGKVRFRKTAGICGRTAGKTCGEGGSCQGCRDISPSQTCRCGQIFFVVAKTGRVSGIKPRKPVRTSNWLAAPRGGRADDLLVIKGIGPVNKRKLNEHGIFHFDQIAAWTRTDIETAEAYLEFDGRIDREDWIGQAKKLAAAADKQASAKRGVSDGWTASRYSRR
jgi:branched-chain amino acid transport system ATP-binding protein